MRYTFQRSLRVLLIGFLIAGLIMAGVGCKRSPTDYAGTKNPPKQPNYSVKADPNKSPATSAGGQ